jgi:UDP-glucose 4-epimerase
VKALVTGGAGFIGSNLVDALVLRGDEVRVFDDLTVGRAKNLSPHLENGRVRLIPGTILDFDALAAHVAWADRVYHLAAVVGVRYVVENPLECVTVNVQGTHNVLSLAAAHGVRTVIASSSEVYGKACQMPLREDGDRVLGPPTASRWSYADSKALDEHLALAYARAGLPVTILRYFNAYGPRIAPAGYGSVVARFIGQALRGEPLTVYGDGAQTRSFTYVADTVEGTLRAGTIDRAVGSVINIGSQEESSIIELARLVVERTGSNSAITHQAASSVFGPTFEEARRRVPDVARARELLGFEARVSLQEGLGRTVRWFRMRERGA